MDKDEIKKINTGDFVNFTTFLECKIKIIYHDQICLLVTGFVIHS